MRGIRAYMFLLGVFLLGPAWAQEEPGHLPENSGESIVLYCDREIYGSGEQIHYLATYNGPEAIKSGAWSSVLYVELISWDGSKQASSKVLLDDKGARGKILIPETIPSGVFYLRAYTLWMRNYSPFSYAYVPLKILNPYSQEMIAGPAEGERDLQALERNPDKLIGEIVLSGLKVQYDTRELVELDIQIPEEHRTGPYNLVIAKTRDQSSDDYEWKQKFTADKGSGKIEFLPEINGLTLSGSIVDTEGKEAVDQTRLQLSSYADPFLFAEAFSGKDGSFLFAFPKFTGNPELHIAEKSDSADGHKILLASEFCNKPVQLPYVPLLIDPAMQSLVREILVNTQLKERYKELSEQIELKRNLYPSFYGDGASVTYVKDYIELADLREFIFEIIPQVSIRSSGIGSGIIIQGPDCLDIYPPLVLLDNIPVPNNDELLNIPGMRIERIEVINRAYMVGNTRYSGIFSIYSNKKDMAGLSEQGERHFFNLKMLDDPGQYAHETDPSDATLPLISNLLYWEPDISFSEEGTFLVQFSTPDTPGSYDLTLRGSDQANGTSVLYRASFSVK